MFNIFGARGLETAPIPASDLERALSQSCAASKDVKSGPRSHITDEDFRRIAGLLRHLEAHHGSSGWSDRPRTYTVLRNIGRTDLMEVFIKLGYQDYSFPYSSDKLPEALGDDALRDKFIKAQRAVLTDAIHLENGHHAYTKNGDDIFTFIRHLGRGGYGSVDQVWSKLSFRDYARKLFPRKRNARDDQALLHSFNQELSHLKRLSHRHLINMVGSYSDQRYVAILMEPVADCNLKEYLRQSQAPHDLPLLRTFFGCLANAVAYLHRQRVRHRDIKPENILLKGQDIRITDFGAALDWSRRGKETTNDTDVPATEFYMAPEIAKRYPRNSASDIWSLGVVFLEMTTVLRGQKISSMRQFIEKRGTRHPCVWSNAQATHQWFELLSQKGTGPDSDIEPLTWIKDMIQSQPQNRPQASALTKAIRTALAPRTFINLCCEVDEETEAYPTPPSSSHSNEGHDLLSVGLEAVQFEHRPFGSMIEDDRATSIHQWLQDDGYPVSEFDSESLLHRTIPEPQYDIVEDGSVIAVNSNVMRSAIPGGQFSRAFSKIIAEGEGYDIVQDDSDSDEDNGGMMYELVEDNSDSGDTVRPTSRDVNIVKSLNKDVKASRQALGNAQLDQIFAEENDPDLIVAGQEKEAISLESQHNRPKAKAPIPKNQTTSNRQLVVPASGSHNLNPQSLAKLALTTERPINKSLVQSARSQKTVRFADAQGAFLSPEAYMQEVWEKASTAPTSIMSERTRVKMSKFGPGIVWQDKSAHFLEHYVKMGYVGAVRALLDAGCNPGTMKKRRIRPLMLAVKGASMRHNKCVAALLSHGADVNAQELRTQKTALHYAVEHPNFSGYTNLIRELLEAGADPNSTDNSGDSPLLQTLYGGYENLEKHKRDALACLLQPHLITDVNVMPPGTRNTPLHLAIRRNDPAAVSMLIHCGAKVDISNGTGLTPLMLAASSWSNKQAQDQMDILGFLVRGGSNVNERHVNTGDTVLYRAACHGFLPAVTFLLKHGADIKIQNNQAENPCLGAGSRINAKRMGAHKHAETMKLLFAAQGYKVDSIIDGQCAALTAILKGFSVNKAIYFEHGADPNFQHPNIPHASPLHTAIAAKDVEMVKILVERGASVDVVSPDAQTAIHHADALGLNLVSMVIKKRGKTESPDNRNVLSLEENLRIRRLKYFGFDR